MNTKLYIVGIEPAQPSPPEHWCTGRFMRRICAASGVTQEAYLTFFQRLNLYPAPQEGPRCKSADRFMASRMFERIISRGGKEVPVIVACGTRVSDAFSWVSGRDSLPVFETCFLAAGMIRLVHIPHPSGRCRAWNDPSTYSKVRELLLPLVATAAPIDPSFPKFLHLDR